MSWIPINIETSNKRMKLIIQNANYYQSELVEMNIIPCCCGECAKYQGRIYSLTGRDSRFPKLPDIVIKTGVIHKDCLHTVYNYKEGDRPFYISGDIITVSNRPFVDDRSEAEKHEYFRDKAGVTTELMSSIASLPFNLNKTIRYDDRYPYIAIDAENILIAEKHIEIINDTIAEWNPPEHGVGCNLSLSSASLKKAKIVCTPYTNTLKIAKTPIYLHFETNKASSKNSVIGNVFYQAIDGAIARVSLCFWNNGRCYKFDLSNCSNQLEVKKFERN